MKKRIFPYEQYWRCDRDDVEVVGPELIEVRSVQIQNSKLGVIAGCNSPSRQDRIRHLLMCSSGSLSNAWHSSACFPYD